MALDSSFTLANQIARRFLNGHSREPLIRFIGRISMVGMAIAVAILILVLSVMNGFEREFTDRILGFVPHATLDLRNKQSESWSEAADRLSQAEGIRRITPFVQLDAMLIRGSRVEPVRLVGQTPEEIARVYADFLSENPEELESNGVFLGHRLAQALGVDTGDAIRLLFNEPADSEQNKEKSLVIGGNRLATFSVAGTLDSGTELDRYVALSSINSVASLKYGAGASAFIDGFHIRVNRLFEVRSVVHAAARESEVYGSFSDWSSEYGNLYLAIQLSRQMVVFLLAAIVAIAAFNIFVTLGMSVRHRQNEIAILKTLGFRKSGLKLTFALQGMYIFIPGFVWGCAGGILLAILLPHLVPVIETLAGIEFLDPSVYPIDYLPSEIRFTDIALTFILALLISLLATLIPAWRAANLQPAAVLK